MRHPKRVLINAAGFMAASLVLGLGTSATAWASGQAGNGNGTPPGLPPSASPNAASGSGGANANPGNSGHPSTGSRGSGASGAPGSSTGHSSTPTSSGVGSRSAGGDLPPGNNGTVKVDEFSMDPGQDEDAHVSCDGFSVSFYGYDGGLRNASIIVTPVAPTPGSGSYETSTSWNVGTRTSGSQLDQNVAVPVSALAPALAGVTPQAQQGYHLRLEVEVTGSQPQASDDKYKVFWLQACPTAPGGPTSSASAATTTTSTTTSTTTATTLATTLARPAIVAAAGSGSLPFDSVLRSAGTATSRSAAPAPVAVAGSHGSLAFTGADIAGLSLAALGLIGTGAALTVRSRRRTPEPDTHS